MFSAREFGSGGQPRREDGLDLVIRNLGGSCAGVEEEAEIGSTLDSVLEGGWELTSGSVRFAKLAAFPYGGGPPSPLDPDLEGTIEWTCPDE